LVPLIRASQVTPFLEAAERIGVPTHRHLDAVRLPEAALHAPGRMIARHQLWGLADSIAEREGIAGFGLEAATSDPVSKLGAFGGELLGEPTLAAALRRLARQIGEHSTHARFEGMRVSSGVRIGRCDDGYRLGGSAVVEQYILRLLVGIVREAEPGWRPRRIWLRGDFMRNVEDEALSGAETIRGSGVTGVEVPAALLARPMRAGPPALGAPATDVPRDFTGTLRAALAPLVGHVRLDLHMAAELAGVDPRTVRRRLVAEGTSWRALLDELRFEHARARLGDPEVRLAEIAHELGYADSAHFARAFRRWACVTPSEFREGSSAPGGRGRRPGRVASCPSGARRSPASVIKLAAPAPSGRARRT